MPAKNPKILSVSIACYNLGALIEQNLQSFLGDPKVYDQLELLVVDDGSTDHDTVARVQKYVKKYPQSVRLIQQPNAGPGATVNTGLKHATGKYFRMVDGDDWVNPHALAHLVEKLKNTDADMVITNYETFHDKRGESVNLFKPSQLKDSQLTSFDDFNYDYNPPIRMHNTIWKTELLKRNRIKLDNGFYTDLEYLLFPTAFVKTLIYFDLNLYVYRIAHGDQSTSPAKLIQNRPKHKAIMLALIQNYRQNVNIMSAGQKSYLIRQIAGALVTHVDVLLLIGGKNLTSNLKDFFKEIKQDYPEFYSDFLIDKKTRLLLKSRFLLAHPFSIYLKNKYKLINR